MWQNFDTGQLSSQRATAAEHEEGIRECTESK